MNIATAAVDCVSYDTQVNIKLHLEHIDKVMELKPDTDIILFPEYSLTGYAEGEDRARIRLDTAVDLKPLQEAAAKYSVAIIIGGVTGTENAFYNSQIFIDDTGRVRATYSKNHLFPEGAEPENYTPGEQLKTVDYRDWKIGLSICFDIRFPRLFATYKENGVELILSSFNWVTGRNKPEIMRNLVKARAHENQFFFAAVDRIGFDDFSGHYGTSVISSPYCEELGEQIGQYYFAKLNKSEIPRIEEQLPLKKSYRKSYDVHLDS